MKTSLPIIALIISFLCEFPLCVSIVFLPFSMWLKQSAHKTKKQRKDGRERGRGARWPPHIEHFPVDFVEGFSAAWLNEQRHANEWRTNVIIYQTKSGGLWGMETEERGEGGRGGAHTVENSWKNVAIKQLFKTCPLLTSPKVFTGSILLMLRVNIPCAADTVISCRVHTVIHLFHVFACRKKDEERERECTKLRGQ